MIFSIVTFGTPNKVRDLNMDSQKISSLTNLSGSILNFYIQNKVLPTSVSEVGYGYKDTLGLNYEYKIISEKEYSLCESFLTEVNYGNDYYLSKWNHPKGYYCFQLNAEKQQY